MAKKLTSTKSVYPQNTAAQNRVQIWMRIYQKQLCLHQRHAEYCDHLLQLSRIFWAIKKILGYLCFKYQNNMIKIYQNINLNEFVFLKYKREFVKTRWLSHDRGITSWDNTAQKMKFSIKDFLSKCDKICKKLWIWSHLLKKSLMENFIFCEV